MRGQTAGSLQADPPEACAQQFEVWGRDGSNCTAPVFAGNPPMVSGRVPAFPSVRPPVINL